MATNTGISLSDLRTTINREIGCYNNLMSSLGTDLETSFVEPMSNVWYSQLAVDFFGSFKSTMETFAGEVTKTYESVVNTLNEIGLAWCKFNNLEGEYVSQEFEACTYNLSIDDIKTMTESGQIYIERDAALDLADNLSILSTTCVDTLDLSINVINQVGALYDANDSQLSSLTTALTNVKTSIVEAADSLKQEVITAIEDTNTKYEEQAASVSAGVSGE